MSKTPTDTSATVCDVLLLLERAENVEQRINYVRKNAPAQQRTITSNIVTARELNREFEQITNLQRRRPQEIDGNELSLQYQMQRVLQPDINDWTIPRWSLGV